MKYFIITYGCQMNKSDSERIATVLEKKKYKPAKNIEAADLIVVNMCSVRQSAVNRVYGLIEKFKKLKDNPPAGGTKIKTILTGCILKKDGVKFAKNFDQVLKFNDLSKLKPKRQGNSIAYIPISNGCNNACTYCAVPYTRGKLICRSHKEIIKEIKTAVKNEFKEIWLLGQNVNDYQSPADSRINFAKLLKMVSNLPGNFTIRFISPHPKPSTRAKLGAGPAPYRNGVSGTGYFSSWDEVIRVMASSPKIAHYLNLPVQSGDNKILKKMNRPYTVERYINLVKKIREKIPNINLSTDVIVGFPGETKKQFENTVKLFKELKFNIAYISKFSPRPGTLAAKLKDDVPYQEKQRREKILRETLKNIHPVKPPVKSFNRGIPPSAELFNRVNKKLIVILGPTASGKTYLSLRLAKKFNGEIVSADSRQIYRELDIGTAKPTKKQLKQIKHYLINTKNPNQHYTVAQYKRDAIKTINKIIRSGKVPFLVGGTGLYIKSITDNLEIPEVKPDWKLRDKLESEIKNKGLKSVYNKLIKLDPEAAYIIDKNNPRRVIRALEIAIKTKKPFSQQRKKGQPLFDILEIGLNPDKKNLIKIINKRVSKMIGMGLLKEVKKLIKNYNKKSHTFDAIGYREIIDHLDKKISLKEALERIKINTWHFAKRQMTWFKKNDQIHWVKNQKEADKLIKNFLKK